MYNFRRQAQSEFCQKTVHYSRMKNDFKKSLHKLVQLTLLGLQLFDNVYACPGGLFQCSDLQIVHLLLKLAVYLLQLNHALLANTVHQ